MFLLGFVNATFETRRPTANLELVDLSLEKNHHRAEQAERRELENHARLQNGSVSFANGALPKGGSNGASPVVKPSELPADLYMEPLRPVLLRSPDGKQMPVYVLEKDAAPSHDLDHEWSFWDQGIENIDTTLASREDQNRDSDSDSDSERDTRTLDAIAEKPCAEVGLPNNDEGFGRILQHLERIEGSVKDLKARVDDAKHRIEQSEHEWGDAGEAKVAPSLSSPVMETMGRMEAPVMEERELRYSPPIVESDAQDVLSFRRWEQEAKPKRKSRRSRGSEELDLETALDLVADEYANSKDLKLPPLPISGSRRFRMRSPWDDDAAAAPAKPSFEKSGGAPKVEVRRCEEAEDFNPSPCSFTCGLSPTSLFSDDQEPFQNVFLKSFANGRAGSRRKSPRSVLSQEPDETSHSTSECSEEDRQPSFCAYLYNDDSSELESPMKAVIGLAHRPFPAFTYNVRDEMGETSSSEEEEEEEHVAAELGELEFFQEAAKLSHWEPWLVKDVLDDSDLEFLLSPDLKIAASVMGKTSPLPIPSLGNEEVKVVPELKMPEQKVVPEQKVPVHRPKSWVPYVTGELQSSEKTVEPQSRPARRSVNFAADLVKEIPYSPPGGPAAAAALLDKKPAPATLKPSLKRHDERGKAWEEGEGPSIMTSRRRWRKWREENATSSSSSSWDARRRRRVPCAGKLFSWPRKLSFKVSKGRGSVESDEESFGTSARRDAEQVRRILKGSQKRYSNLSVDEIMKEDFGK